MTIHDLEPKQVWKHFFHICSIPHPSHHEAALADSIISWATKLGFNAVSDKAGNVIIRRTGKIDKGIILQAHLDMVPQKGAESKHDFLKDPIQPRIDPNDNDWLIATDTTLGADNGIGVAMAMAMLEDAALKDMTLECLFTTDEEDGMTGAAALEEKYLKGKVLINLDGEESDEITVGCAGTLRSKVLMKHDAITANSNLAALHIKLGGLLGGHSGVDIHKCRANAVLTLLSIVSKVNMPVFIASVDSGTAANAIPRDAEMVVFVDDASAWKAAFMAEVEKQKKLIGPCDPGLTAVCENYAAKSKYVLDAAASKDFVKTFTGLINGLIEMETEVKNVPKTSLNLGQLHTKIAASGFEAEAVIMVRSSDDEAKSKIAHKAASQLEALKQLTWNVVSTIPDGSPAWSPNFDSSLLKKAKSVYKKLYNADVIVSTTHGGLETALFKPRFKHWDMLSLGPDIRYPHSPDERLNIASVGNSYNFVKELLLSL